MKPIPREFAKRMRLIWIFLSLTLLAVRVAEAESPPVQVTWRLLDYVAVDYRSASSFIQRNPDCCACRGLDRKGVGALQEAGSCVSINPLAFAPPRAGLC